MSCGRIRLPLQAQSPLPGIGLYIVVVLLSISRALSDSPGTDGRPKLEFCFSCSSELKALFEKGVNITALGIQFGSRENQSPNRLCSCLRTQGQYENIIVLMATQPYGIINVQNKVSFFNYNFKNTMHFETLKSGRCRV